MPNRLNMIDRKKMIGSLCEKHLEYILNKLKHYKDGRSLEAMDSVHPCQSEIKLWAQLKKFNDTNDANLVKYIHGFYLYLHQLCILTVTDKSVDPYFIKTANLLSNSMSQDNLLLIYNINIRLGDLNRYLRNVTMARYYYTRARELIPERGHAYNQLACISTNDPIKSIYYSVRAFLATQEPVNIAENNIRSAVNRFSLVNQVIKSLFTNEPSQISSLTKIENWFYVIVIASYCNNFNPMVSCYLTDMINFVQSVDAENETTNENTKEDTNNVKRQQSEKLLILSSIDLFIDLVTLQSNVEKVSLLEFEKEFKSLKEKITKRTEDEVTIEKYLDKALRQDHLLLGFSPLKESHQKLIFDQEFDYNLEKQILFKRILIKLNKLLANLSEKKGTSKAKKSRNIALQSILGSKSS